MVPTTGTGDGKALCAEPAADTYRPLCDPEPLLVGDPAGPSSIGWMEVTPGDTALSCWGGCETVASIAENLVKLQLAPDRPVVIGRFEGIAPPYLDPSFLPTQMVPGTGQPIVRSMSHGKDINVSRAHFMLRGNAQGILLTNGVPRLGGGIRPPTNGTWIVAPCFRLMDPEEEYQIEHGQTLDLYLPNGTVVRIGAQ